MAFSRDGVLLASASADKSIKAGPFSMCLPFCPHVWPEQMIQAYLSIKGPDNPTRQLLPIMSTRCCSGDGEGRKDKEGGGGSRSKTKLWVTKLYVKDCV